MIPYIENSKGSVRKWLLFQHFITKSVEAIVMPNPQKISTQQDPHWSHRSSFLPQTSLLSYGSWTKPPLTDFTIVQIRSKKKGIMCFMSQIIPLFLLKRDSKFLVQPCACRNPVVYEQKVEHFLAVILNYWEIFSCPYCVSIASFGPLYLRNLLRCFAIYGGHFLQISLAVPDAALDPFALGICHQLR